MVGCCEFGDEFQTFIKCCEFLVFLVEEILGSEEGLYSMKLS